MSILMPFNGTQKLIKRLIKKKFLISIIECGIVKITIE